MFNRKAVMASIVTAMTSMALVACGNTDNEDSSQVETSEIKPGEQANPDVPERPERGEDGSKAEALPVPEQGQSPSDMVEETHNFGDTINFSSFDVTVSNPREEDGNFLADVVVKNASDKDKPFATSMFYTEREGGEVLSAAVSERTENFDTDMLKPQEEFKGVIAFDEYTVAPISFVDEESYLGVWTPE